MDTKGVSDALNAPQTVFQAAFPSAQTVFQAAQGRTTMLMLITYDISLQDPEGASRLRRVAQYCRDYGVRVQYSVFECDIAPDQWVKLKAKLLATYNPATDSLRFYHLGSKWRRKVEHHGAKPAPDVFRDTLIV